MRGPRVELASAPPPPVRPVAGARRALHRAPSRVGHRPPAAGVPRPGRRRRDPRPRVGRRLRHRRARAPLRHTRPDATGVDLAPTALAAARAKADRRHLTARFLRHDALRLADLAESFDMVIDCGLFHVFDDADRATFVAGLRTVLEPGGRYVMLCFSDAQPGDTGPHRVTRDEIAAAFREGWRIDSVEPATIDTLTDPDGIQA